MKLEAAAFLFAVLMVSTDPAAAASILLAPSNQTIDVAARLTGLGHSVTVSNPATWGPSFDYSPYDVVAFQYNSSNPADIAHLVSAVDAGEVGVVFFRGYTSEPTAIALGLIGGGAVLNWQTPTSLNVLDNSHPITQGLTIGLHSLGYDYMSRVEGTTGASTTTLATGPGGAALVVHQTRRVALTPFYGHESNYANENATGLALTQATIAWAAGGAPVSAQRTTWGAIKTLYRD